MGVGQGRHLAMELRYLPGEEGFRSPRVLAANCGNGVPSCDGGSGRHSYDRPRYRGLAPYSWRDATQASHRGQTTTRSLAHPVLAGGAGDDGYPV